MNVESELDRPCLAVRAAEWEQFGQSEWELIDVHVGPGTQIPDFRQCVSMVSLVANAEGTASADDGFEQKEFHQHDIWLSSGRNMRSLTFHGRAHLLVLVVYRAYMLQLAERLVPSLPCVFNPTIQVRDQEISQSMADLRKRVLLRKPTGRLCCDAYASAIGLRALRRAGLLPLHAHDYKDPLPVNTLNTVLDYMYDNVGDSSLRAATLAEVAGLAVDTFRHRFRRSLGKSVHQSLLEIRIEVAAHKLLATPRSVSQIAMDTGFADHSHFTKVFHERVGTTPSDYRDAAREKRRDHEAPVQTMSQLAGGG